MFSPRMEVVFRVQAETRAGEAVCVVGNTPELGNWKPAAAQVLQKESQNGSSEVWHRTLPLCVTGEIQYRYFIGHILDSENEESERYVIVSRWETALKPRTLSTGAPSNANGCDNKTGIAEFGLIDGVYRVDRGWLSGQTEVQLRLFGAPINMWKSKYRNTQYRIKCTTVDLRYRDMNVSVDDDESTQDIPSASHAHRALVSVLNGTDDVPSEQHQFGHVRREGDYTIFQAQTFDYESTGFQFDFYSYDANASADDVPKHIGNTFLLPVNFKAETSKGLINLPITGSRNIPIGDFTVEYLIVKPLTGHQCDMSVSYATYWNTTRAALDVGHRGLGGSFSKNKPNAPVRENTIASLNQAGGHGADMVEFDVQLCKDLVPVIYHDLTVCLTLQRKKKESQEMFEIPVQDLKMEQLQLLKLEHASERSSAEQPQGPSLTDSDTDILDQTPFPTLKEVMEKLDPHIWLNIEIKYCMKLKNGDLEEGLKHFPERNKYTNIILKEVFAHAGDRKILFSSFDPDICSMVRLKQNKYPIVYLTQGASQKYDDYYDIRTRTSAIACHFALSAQILGVNYHSEDLLRIPDLIQTARDLGLIVFCWGEDNNSKQNIDMFKKAGVHGVIYDRINEFIDAGKQGIFKMERKAKVELLQNVGAISNGNGQFTPGENTPESSFGNGSGISTPKSNCSGPSTPT